MFAPQLTVLTPTYNRAHTLHRVYESLQRQASQNFEWLIIDDGSSDSTEELVQRWLEESTFSIRYYRQSNGGKHTAVNYGMLHARGKYTTIFDSDDAFTPDAMLLIEAAIRNAEATAATEIGVIGFLTKSDANDAICGDAFPQSGMVSSYSELKYRFRRSGEWQFVVKTALLRRYKQPEFLDTNLRPIRVAESIVWRRLSHACRYLLINQAIRIYYTHDGELRLTTRRPDDPSRFVRKLVNCHTILTEDDRWLFVQPSYFLRCAFLYLKFGAAIGLPLSTQIAAVRSARGILACLLVAPFGFLRGRSLAKSYKGKTLVAINGKSLCLEPSSCYFRAQHLVEQ